MAFPKGRKHSAEARAKIAASLRGRPLSEATKAKLSAANRGKPKSPAHREAMQRAWVARRERLRKAMALLAETEAKASAGADASH